jgi:hypothetical protein
MPQRVIASDVAFAETWTPSRRLQAAAAAERQRLERELDRLAARERELAAELAAVQKARAALAEEVGVLNRLANDAVPPQIPGTVGRRLRAVPEPGSTSSNGRMVLRGAAIREAAVRVLAAHSQPDKPVHYRDWFELLTAHGFVPAGKDPLATFLTQIGRSPVVRRSTASGMYVLDLEFPERARLKLAQLSDELAHAQAVSASNSVEEIAAAREARARVTAEMHELERRLEEALRCLAAPEP